MKMIRRSRSWVICLIECLTVKGLICIRIINVPIKITSDSRLCGWLYSGLLRESVQRRWGFSWACEQSFGFVLSDLVVRVERGW